MSPRRFTVAAVVGTRPDAIKLAAIIRSLEARGDATPVVLATAQHREMLDQVLALFGITPAFDLDLMRPDQSISELASRVLSWTSQALRTVRPDMVLVQGDTTTALMGAQAAFFSGCAVGHVEAGLRSYRPRDPFPEEMNRRAIASFADIHFAPTPRNRDNLLNEGIDRGAIFVTGNPVIDALKHVAATVTDDDVTRAVGPLERTQRMVLVTVHRRESFGAPLEAICCGIRTLVDRHPDIVAVIPVHLNPRIRSVVWRILSGHPRVRLLDPLDYRSFVSVMRGAFLVLTDSGGVQEEAPALGKPVLVLRDVTERPEGVEAGTARVIGRTARGIVEAGTELLRNPDAYARMARSVNPYGDGRAAERITEAVATYLGRRRIAAAGSGVKRRHDEPAGGSFSEIPSTGTA